jgi:hypothetical protein
MPVSATASDPIVVPVAPLPRVDGDGAVIGKLVGVAQEVEQRLTQPHLVGMQRFDCRITMDCNLICVLCCQWLDGLNHVGDQRREREGFEMQLHPPGLDLGKVENIVDQGEQMPPRAKHAIVLRRTTSRPTISSPRKSGAVNRAR